MNTFLLNTIAFHPTGEVVRHLKRARGHGGPRSFLALPQNPRMRLPVQQLPLKGSCRLQRHCNKRTVVAAQAIEQPVFSKHTHNLDITISLDLVMKA